MWWPHTMLVLMMMIYVWRALTIDHRHSTGSVYPADLTKIRCRNCMIVLCVPMESKNDASESKYNFNYVLRFQSKMCVSVDKYDCWTGLELHITRWWCLARTRAHHAGRWTWCVRLYVWVWAYCEPLKTKKKWRNPSCGEAERKNNMEKYGLVIFHVVRIGITSFRIYTWFAAFCMCLTRPSQWLVVGWGASHTIAGTGNKSPCRVIKIRHNTGHCMNLNSKVVHAS